MNAAYGIAPTDLTNAAGLQVTAGGTDYTVVTTVYASDLATDINPERGKTRVSIGLIMQANAAGDVVIAVRGTEGILEWVHDAEFLLVPCPFLVGAGHTEDGFTAMYRSLRTGVSDSAPTVVAALGSLPFPRAVTSVTICGHSLGGALVTLLALDVAANSNFRDLVVYSYASPRTGDPLFASTFNQVVKNSFRIANRLDLVPKLPFPPFYEHVNQLSDLIPIDFKALPPPDPGEPDDPLRAHHQYISIFDVTEFGRPGPPARPGLPALGPVVSAVRSVRVEARSARRTLHCYPRVCCDAARVSVSRSARSGDPRRARPREGGERRDPKTDPSHPGLRGH